MRIVIVTPAAPGSRSGNRNTAQRWAGLLRELGHTARVVTQWDGRDADIMIALHARRSHLAVTRFREMFPNRPLAVALTGTDLYRDLAFDTDARESLGLADRLIVLQDRAPRAVPAVMRRKIHVIYQSVAPIRRGKPPAQVFQVCVSGHLREEKDPFRAALALKFIPGSSLVRVAQLGRAMSDAMRTTANSLAAADARYRWLGELPHARALAVLAASHLMVISSWIEGGANVVSEAIAAGIPILASRIPGNVGMLGANYPGYYQAGDERALARLLRRAERDRMFLESLRIAVAARRPLVTRAAERQGLRHLLASLAPRARD